MQAHQRVLLIHDLQDQHYGPIRDVGTSSNGQVCSANHNINRSFNDSVFTQIADHIAQAEKDDRIRRLIELPEGAVDIPSNFRRLRHAIIAVNVIIIRSHWWIKQLVGKLRVPSQPVQHTMSNWWSSKGSWDSWDAGWRADSSWSAPGRWTGWQTDERQQPAPFSPPPAAGD